MPRSSDRTTTMDGDDLNLMLATRLREAGAGADAFCVITRLVFDVYDKVHPAYLGYVGLSGGHPYGDRPERVKTTREVCEDLYSKAVAAGWVSGSNSCTDRTTGQVLAMHEAEVSTFSIKARDYLTSVGLGWRVEKDGSYTITDAPNGRALLTDVKDDARTAFVIGQTQDHSWIFRTAERPADDGWRMRKLFALLVAAYDGGGEAAVAA